MGKVDFDGCVDGKICRGIPVGAARGTRVGAPMCGSSRHVKTCDLCGCVTCDPPGNDVTKSGKRLVLIQVHDLTLEYGVFSCQK